MPVLFSVSRLGYIHIKNGLNWGKQTILSAEVMKHEEADIMVLYYAIKCSTPNDIIHVRDTLASSIIDDR